MNTKADAVINETEAQEQLHLQHIAGKIAAELSTFTARLNERHSEAREIIDGLQENKRDMDHAEKANMRQSVNVMTRINEHGVAQQRRLERLLHSPYFGRIDIDDPLSDSDPGAARSGDQPIYIGIHSFYDAQSGSPLVHDWRAPISSMFYEFELGEAHYEAPAGRMTHNILRKRQYRIEKGSLVFMLETSLNIQDDLLQKELSRASDDAMKNIVATIQRDQNIIIRDEKAHTLIIQGAAGSGKTSIALHRIAFLLYRYRDSIKSSEILIISPNKVFAHYISQVLPELGEEMIQEITMEGLASRLLGPGFKFQSFAEQVYTLLKGDDPEYAVRVRFKATPELVTKLEEYIAHVQGTNVTPRDVGVGAYTLKADWIAERFRRCTAMPIGEQITRVLQDIVDHMQLDYQKKVVGKERAKIRTELKDMFALTTLKPLYANFYQWLGKPEMLQQIRGRYEYADIFPLIYLSRLVERTQTMRGIKHVVIDEMQDYTPIQYKVIDSLYPCRKTILGDHNQSVSPLSSSSAERIQSILRSAQCMYMHKSYRSTIEITQVAQSIHRNPNLVPIRRHGERPSLIGCQSAQQEIDSIDRLVHTFLASGYNTLGIICKTSEQATQLYKSLRGHSRIRLLDHQSTSFTGGIMIATAYLAKGLEFDQVIIPFASEQNYTTDIDRHMLYIACTRAMHNLAFTHTGSPTTFLKSALQQSLLNQSA